MSTSTAPDTIVITDPAGPLTIRIEESPVTVQIEEETVTVEPGGDEEITVSIDDEKTTVLTIFELASPPTGPAEGDLTGYYPAPTLKPIVTPGVITYPQSLTVDAKGRITAYQAGSVPSGSDKTYVHNQLSVSSAWVINHNLGKLPAIQVFDSAGSQVVGYGRTDDLSLNTTTLSFSAGFTGKAPCN